MAPKAYNEVMDQAVVDEVIIVDDATRDDTVAVARSFQGLSNVS